MYIYEKDHDTDKVHSGIFTLLKAEGHFKMFLDNPNALALFLFFYYTESSFYYTEDN